MTISHSGTPERTTRRWPRPTLKPGQGLAYRGPPGAFPRSITLLPGLYRAPVRMQQHTWGPSAPHPHLGLFFALRLSRFLKLPALTRAKYQLAGPGGGREGMGRGQGPEAGKCGAQEPVHVPKSEAQVERRAHSTLSPKQKSESSTEAQNSCSKTSASLSLLRGFPFGSLSASPGFVTSSEVEADRQCCEARFPGRCGGQALRPRRKRAAQPAPRATAQAPTGLG